MKLKRVKQCSKCPWKRSVNPFEIPNGYDEEKHKALKETIATGAVESMNAKQPSMACHESTEGNEDFCVGWLINQIGPGNNIGLRLKMLKYENASELEVYGEQCSTFEETLPENKLNQLGV